MADYFPIETMTLLFGIRAWLLRDFNGCKVVTEVILVERKNTQMNPEPGSGAVSRVTLLHPRHGLETQAADWSDSANQRVVSGYIDQSEN